MESLGFAYDAESHEWPLVTWRGHGVSLRIWREMDEPTPPEVATAIVQQARADGANEARRVMQSALGLKPDRLS